MNWLNIFDRPIAFYPCFVTLTGSIHAGLMLSQAFYWSKRTKNPDGWFYKTQDDWTKETCLSRREQQTARKHLRAAKFWQEERRGMPAKIHFRLDLDLLEEALHGDEVSVTIEYILQHYSNALVLLSKAAHMRAVKAGVKSEYVDYREVLKLKGMICGICREPITRGIGIRSAFLTFDHIVPIIKQGSHTPENIQPSHAGCNAAKSGRAFEIKTSSRLSLSNQDGLDKANQSDSPNVNKSSLSKPTPLIETKTTTENTTMAQALRAARVSDTGRLMGILARTIGPIANQGKQANAIRWLLDRGYTVEQIESCLKFVHGQKWRDTTVDLWTVAGEIERYVKQNEKPQRDSEQSQRSRLRKPLSE